MSMPAASSPRWHEYGGASTVLIALSQVSLAVIAGVGTIMLVGLLLGLLTEGSVLSNLLEGWGLEYADASGISHGIDMMFRMTLASGPLVGVLACLVWAGSHYLLAGQVSRVLVARAADSANPNEVPSPLQVGAVIGAGRMALPVLLGILAFLGACATALVAAFADSLALTLVFLLSTTVATALLVLLLTVFRRTHRARAVVIAGYWAAAEQKAFDRATARRFTRPGRARGAKAVDGVLSSIGLGLVYVGVLAVVTLMMILYPDGQLWPGGQAGPRATYAEPITAILNVVMILAVAAVVAGLVLTFVGSLIGTAAAGRERAAMLAELPEVPEAFLLRQHRYAPAPFGRLIAGVAGAMCTLALSLFWLSAGNTFGAFSDLEPFAQTRGGALIALVVAGMLTVFSLLLSMMNVSRERDVRNTLLARAPMRRTRASSDDGSDVPVQFLTPQLRLVKAPSTRSR